MAGRRKRPAQSPAAAELAREYDRARRAAAALDAVVAGAGDRVRRDITAAVAGALERSLGGGSQLPQSVIRAQVGR